MGNFLKPTKWGTVWNLQNGELWSLFSQNSETWYYHNNLRVHFFLKNILISLPQIVAFPWVENQQNREQRWNPPIWGRLEFDSNRTSPFCRNLSFFKPTKWGTDIKILHSGEERNFDWNSSLLKPTKWGTALVTSNLGNTRIWFNMQFPIL